MLRADRRIGLADIDKVVAAILAAAQVSATGKQQAERYVEQYREILALLDMEESDERHAAIQREHRAAAGEGRVKRREA
jgi:hypothetical protein